MEAFLPVIYLETISLEQLLIIGMIVGNFIRGMRKAVNNRITSYNVCYTKLLRISERVDIVKRADGSVISELPVVGVMEIKNGKVSRWSEYFNPSDFKGSEA